MLIARAVLWWPVLAQSNSKSGEDVLQNLDILSGWRASIAIRSDAPNLVQTRRASDYWLYCWQVRNTSRLDFSRAARSRMALVYTRATI